MEKENIQMGGESAQVATGGRLQQLRGLWASVERYPWPGFCTLLIVLLYIEHSDHREDLNKSYVKDEFYKNYFIEQARQAKEREEKKDIFYNQIQRHAVDTIFLTDGNIAGAGRAQQ